MKKLLLILPILSFISCHEKSNDNSGKLSADLVDNPISAEGTNPQALKELPTMDFTDTMHSFGNINEGEVVTYDFEFKNNGKKPLIITNASGSCGCTAPDYPHDPIKPGETNIIKVKFNSAGKPNHQHKTVSIHTNSNKGLHTLHIEAEVKPGEPDPNIISTTLNTATHKPQ